MSINRYPVTDWPFSLEITFRLLSLKKVQHNDAETTMQCAHILGKFLKNLCINPSFSHQNTAQQAQKITKNSL
jgi:hypothetical protein